MNKKYLLRHFKEAPGKKEKPDRDTMCVPDLVTLSSVYLHCYRLFAEYTALEWKAMAFRFSVYFNDFAILSVTFTKPPPPISKMLLHF